MIIKTTIKMFYGHDSERFFEINGPRREKKLTLLHENKKGTGQPSRTRCFISAFAVCFLAMYNIKTCFMPNNNLASLCS